MIQTMRTTIQSALFMLTLALFGPLAASAAQGEFVVATRAATGTTLAAGWVRFAESVPGGGNNAGVFDIRWTGTNTATNIGGHVRVSIGANSNDETQIGMVLNDASSQGAPAIGRVRLLEGTAGTTMYLEAYVNVALSSLEFVHEAGYGWALVGPTPTLSTTLTTHELDTTGAFAVNEGSKSFMVTKDGKVGIGTTTPKNKLDVEGGLVVGATYSGTNTAPTNGLLVEGNTGIGTTTVTTVSYGKVTIASSAVPLAFQETDVSVDQGGFWRMPLDAGILRFDVNTSTSGNFVPYITPLAMTKAGNVGIGTIAPVNKLDVEGGLAVGATYSGTNAAPANGLLVEGNTGIGTTTPKNKLDVEGGLAVGATYSGTNTAPTNGLLVEGRVGIGTTTLSAGQVMIAAPSVPLAFKETDVAVDQGGFWRMPLEGGMLRFDVNTSAGGDFATYKAALSMTKDAKVGIGTMGPDQLLSVNGNASKVGGGSWVVYSDNRLKTIAGTFDAGLNEVLKLQPIRYRYKKDNPLHLPDEREHIGFSAQEVQKIIPGAISENSQGYLMLNSDPILWAMLNAIKDQQKTIKELMGKVSEMDTLKVQLKELQDILRPTMAKR